jgi:hypothetical protein
LADEVLKVTSRPVSGQSRTDLRDAAGPRYGRSSGRRLPTYAPGASTASGTGLVQWACHSGANEQWAADDLGNGYLRLKATHSGMCADLAGQSTVSGAAVVQAACGAGNGQQWVTEYTDSGCFRLKSRQSGLCIDVNGASSVDGATVIQWTCGGGGNQQWRTTIRSAGVQTLSGGAAAVIPR